MPAAPPTAAQRPAPTPGECAAIAHALKADALALGFTAAGIADADLAADEARLSAWLAAGLHGEMHYMQRFGADRARPAAIVPGTVRVVSVRLDYWPGAARPAQEVLGAPTLGYLSRYALGRDYHRLMRNRLEALARRAVARIGPFGYRAFVDSGPVLEKPLARNAGLGWIGRHTNLIAREAGSYFFLGELYTDLPLPVDAPAADHCGTCRACIEACPTRAIVAPYQLDARRCISYLTIELKGSIPLEFRALLGNRVYGCDDCQLVCPWNKFARAGREAGFSARPGLDAPSLLELFALEAAGFAARFAGSAVRRIGHERWLRNVAVALGNAPHSPAVVRALGARADHASSLVREHVAWALARHAQ